MRLHDLRNIGLPRRHHIGSIGRRAIAHAEAAADSRRAEIRARVAERVRKLLETAAKQKKGRS